MASRSGWRGGKGAVGKAWTLVGATGVGLFPSFLNLGIVLTFMFISTAHFDEVTVRAREGSAGPTEKADAPVAMARTPTRTERKNAIAEIE